MTKRAVHTIAVLTIAILLGFLMLLLVYLIPQSKLDVNVETSLPVLQAEHGGTTAMALMPETEQDFFTDAIMVNTCYTVRGSLIEQVLLCQGYWWGAPADELADYFYADSARRDEMELHIYGRYWHGYQIFLRPMLTVFHINQIRMLVLMAQTILGIGIIYLLCKVKKDKLIVPVVVLWLLLIPIITLINLTYAAVMLTTELAMIFLLWEKWHNRSLSDKLFFLMEVNGICIGYFDLLTYPSVAFAAPMILFYCLDAEQRVSLKKRVSQFLQGGIAWALGYGGMFLGKWGLATMLTNENIIKDGVETFLFRSSGEWKGEKIGFFEVLQTNIGYYNTAVYKILLLAAGVVFLLLLRKSKLNIQPDICIGVLLSMLVPFGWYFLVRNHSMIHAFFTFRTFSPFLFGVLILPYQSLLDGDEEGFLQASERKG